jgi:hypothetical protein
MKRLSRFALALSFAGPGCHLLVASLGPETCEAASTPPACSANGQEAISCQEGILISTPCADACNPQSGQCVACENGIDDGNELCLSRSPDTLAVGASPSAMLPFDVEGDGDLDLVATNADDDTFTIHFNDGAPGFRGTSDTQPIGSEPVALSFADINGDALLDLVVANRTGNEIATRLSQRDGDGNLLSFSLPGPSVSTGGFPVSVSAGDIDADGADDIAFLNLSERVARVAKGDGAGNFLPDLEVFELNDHQHNILALIPTSAGFPGRLDLVAASGLDNVVTLLITPSPPPPLLAPLDFIDNEGLSPSSLSLGNFTTNETAPDALADFAIAYRNTNNILVFLNTGDGPPTKIANLPTGRGPEALLVLDLDGDGDDDFATADSADNTVSVIENLGAGLFAERQIFGGVGTQPIALVPGDFNLDGRLDLAVLSRSSEDIHLLLGGI